MIMAGDISVEGADGLWDGSNVRIGGNEYEGASATTFHDDALEKDPASENGKPVDPNAEHQGTSTEGWLSGEEMKAAFAYDEATLAARVKSGDIQRMSRKGIQLYKVKPVKLDTFTQIVLHEIGHSVDDILGHHTSPVYEFAKWHEFNDEQFDQWAAEMGGWEKVASADKAQIRHAWMDAARAKHAVKDLVSSDHPALADRYADVGLVKMGRDGRSFSAWNRDIINGRMFVAGSYMGQWYSVDAAIVPSAPSYYSLFAPAEYFAESYVEYYRGVDGSVASESKKGGMLAAPVKRFFDIKVDALKYDPRRVQGAP